AVRRQLGETDAVDRAREVLGVHAVRLAAALEQGQRVKHSSSLFQGGFDGVVESAVGALDDDAVDHYGDVVLTLLVEVDVLVEIADDAVDAGAGEAALAGVG